MVCREREDEASARWEGRQFGWGKTESEQASGKEVASATVRRVLVAI